MSYPAKTFRIQSRLPKAEKMQPKIIENVSRNSAKITLTAPFALCPTKWILMSQNTSSDPNANHSPFTREAQPVNSTGKNRQQLFRTIRLVSTI
jgi:hypothetical protein